MDTVLSKLPLTMSGQNLEIEIYSPTPDEPVIQDTIEVRGPPDVISSEVLDLYFENKKKSAGGEIIKIKKEGNVAYVTYASEEGKCYKYCLLSVFKYFFHDIKQNLRIDILHFPIL